MRLEIKQSDYDQSRSELLAKLLGMLVEEGAQAQALMRRCLELEQELALSGTEFDAVTVSPNGEMAAVKDGNSVPIVMGGEDDDD